MLPIPFSNPPVIICGAHGGGTSYITKMLRFCGFFAGNDAGDLFARKYHESNGFKLFNREFAQYCGNEFLMTDDSIAQAESEMINNLDFWLKKADDSLPVIFNSYLGADIELPWRFKTRLLYYFGSPFKSKIWGWKGYLLYLHREKYQKQPWGWKDPRNSLTLPVWKNLFPEAKILIISKVRSDKQSKSSSGKWFNEKASPKNLEVYQNPPLVHKFEDVLAVKFEELVHSYNEFNNLLEWTGLGKLSEKQFTYLKIHTNFEMN